MMSDLIHILVADDHPIVREGLVAILSTQTDFQVVGEAGNGDEVVRQVEALQPDVILLDLEMPGMDGVEALGRIRLTHPHTQAIIFTAFDTDERILAAVRAGAKGYLLKGAPRDEIFKAVRVASQGGSLLQPVVASKLLQHVAHPAESSPALTRREVEVLHLLADGKTNKEIAAILNITQRTAKFHVSAILRKLEAGNRTEALANAARSGLIEY
jgi:DNA-binding NarL/FixJ family response regulator